MQPPPSEEDAQLAFENGFSQLTHRAFSTKFPELVEYMQTFKVVNSDIEAGSATGAFILSVDGETVIVPAILARNQLKPIEVMYVKRKDIFLPLSRDWLKEVSRSSLDNLGEGVTPPKAMEYDADIRRLVVPPTIGRFSYAAEGPKGLKLAQFLDGAPNNIKEAFSLVLRQDKKLLKFAFEHYDKDMLLTALKPKLQKLAEEPRLFWLTPDSSESEFRQIFGKQASAAYQESVKKGYVVQDERPITNKIVDVEGPLKFTSVNKTGFFKVLLQDGTRRPALVLFNPQGLVQTMYGAKRTDQTPYSDPYRKHFKKPTYQLIETQSPDIRTEDQPDVLDQHSVVIFEDKTYIPTREPVVGEELPLQDVPKALLGMFESDATPHGLGFFVRLRGGRAQATEPCTIESMTVGSDKVRRLKVFLGGDRVLVTDPKSALDQITAPKDSNVTYLPSTYRFVGLEGERNGKELLKGSHDTLPFLSMLEKAGAIQIKLIDAKGGSFSIGGLESQDKTATIQNLVAGCQLRIDDAEAMVEKVASRGTSLFYLVNDHQLRSFAKFAQGATEPSRGSQQEAAPAPSGTGAPPDPNAAGGMPMDPGMMDPNMMDPNMMDPSMMAPPPPPPPSPVEMAVGQISTEVAQQSADIAQQMADHQQQLADKLQILDEVKSRAAQIAMETGMMGAETAPVGSMMPPGMDPNMMGGMPPDMSGMAGPAGSPGSMPPAAPGPAMGPPSSMAGPAAAGSAGPTPMPPMELAQQAAPYMQQAAGLGQFGDQQASDAFEATSIGALGAMSQDSDLKSSLADYIPVLEEALDNLGRMIMALWMNEDKFRDDMGDEDFAGLEEKLTTVFNNLGTLVLMINQLLVPVVSTKDEAISRS
jgi:hypothetical protein